MTILAVAGCVWIVPKNGAVEVTTSNALHDSVPVATRFVPIRPSYSRHVFDFTDVAVNAPVTWLGVIAVVVSTAAVWSVFLSYVRWIPDCGENV